VSKSAKFGGCQPLFEENSRAQLKFLNTHNLLCRKLLVFDRKVQLPVALAILAHVVHP